MGGEHLEVSAAVCQRSENSAHELLRDPSNLQGLLGGKFRLVF